MSELLSAVTPHGAEHLSPLSASSSPPGPQELSLGCSTWSLKGKSEPCPVPGDRTGDPFSLGGKLQKSVFPETLMHPTRPGTHFTPSKLHLTLCPCSAPLCTGNVCVSPKSSPSKSSGSTDPSQCLRPHCPARQSSTQMVSLEFSLIQVHSTIWPFQSWMWIFHGPV